METWLDRTIRKLRGIDTEDEVDTDDIIIIRPATPEEIEEAEKRGDL